MNIKKKDRQGRAKDEIKRVIIKKDF